MKAAAGSRQALLLALAFDLALACAKPAAQDGAGRPPGADPAADAPAPTAGPLASGVPSEPGLFPSKPLPRGSVAALTNVRVAVADVQRGDAAWRALRAASPANAPAGEGWEFVLVRLELTGVAPSSQVGCSDFRLVGAARIAFFHGPQFPPEPELEGRTLRAGEKDEGWCVYPIRAQEHDLILMINEPDSRDPTGLRYLALDEGASLAPAPVAPRAAGEPAGESPLAAAPLGREVVTQDWSVAALEIVRGEDARNLVRNANPGNRSPREGLEFVAVKLHARYQGRSEGPGLLSRSQFRAMRADGAYYEIPAVIDLDPGLDRTLFPGGEHTGWAVFEVDPGDARAVLSFEPLHPDGLRRYLALTEGEAQGSAGTPDPDRPVEGGAPDPGAP